MDISGAQLNSVAISAYNAQLQTAIEQNRQAQPQVNQPRSLAPEVSLSRQGREQSARESGQARDVSLSPTPSASPQPTPAPQDTSAEGRRETPRTPAPQPQSTETASRYTVRVALQSYFSVSNF